MKTVTVYKRDGSESGTIELPDDIFGVEPSMHALQQVVTTHLANRRQGTACAKTRSEVKVTKSKPYRQKGTGRARAGSANSPLWVGGGVTFGPRPRTYNKRLNKKLRRLALKSAFSIKASEKGIRVVEDFTLETPRTKDIATLLSAMGIDGKKTVFLTGSRDEVLLKSSRNIPTVRTHLAESAHTYQVMNCDFILFTTSGLDQIKEVFKG
jgi:large subunit ribosomal protein L4